MHTTLLNKDNGKIESKIKWGKNNEWQDRIFNIYIFVMIEE